MIRLERRLASLSTLSRSQARTAIRRGRVTVDGVRQRAPATTVPEDAVIALDGTVLQEVPLLAVLHKPSGVQCTVGDPLGRPSLAQLAAELLALGLHPVGRLDADTSGLLLFSSDGGLTQRLLHPRHHVSKRYLATVENPPAPGLAEVLAAGVATSTGVHPARLLRLEGQALELEVTEGKHRMVRRMLANAGHPVGALHRLQVGAVVLGDLPGGTWRWATADELAWAAALRGGQVPSSSC